jgi:hypothetical protein
MYQEVGKVVRKWNMRKREDQESSFFGWKKKSGK